MKPLDDARHLAFPAKMLHHKRFFLSSRSFTSRCQTLWWSLLSDHTIITGCHCCRLPTRIQREKESSDPYEQHPTSWRVSSIWTCNGSEELVNLTVKNFRSWLRPT
ncbi:hypothetical protein K443DRAFT_298713 [Laccaria amethystina LaAM-08-1]|uniref:Uncharacterized protein n=1 Tax=Laccaria amethystina LaAM-08-1 TaxID=1095629 RepID=A0A0C9XBU7_9AGAR|nr:hypothetical protein K443DRAFT_298713 [Laccaria amethystina LaAM-08-1]